MMLLFLTVALPIAENSIHIDDLLHRLDGALESLDTFRAEVSHYTWKDFLDSLGSALGGGAVYKEGRTSFRIFATLRFDFYVIGL